MTLPDLELVNPGEILESYCVGALIGRGGMGAVYAARHVTLDREVAVKVLQVPDPGAAEAIGRFQQESKVLARLNHPGIMPILDAGTQNGKSYLAMPRMFVPTLSSVIAQLRSVRCTLPEHRALAIADSLLEVLEVVHTHGIIHRDIKPANIFLEDDDTIVLTDFGLAICDGAPRFTEEGNAMGTVIYAAPEMLLGAEVDHRADIYSAGLVLCEMLSGTLPFRGNLYNVLNQKRVLPGLQFQQLAGIASTATVNLLEVACRTQPADRWASASAFRGAIQEVLCDGAQSPSVPKRGKAAAWLPAVGAASGATNPTGPTRPLVRPVPPTGRRAAPELIRTGLGALALVLLGVVIGSTWTTSHQNQKVAAPPRASALVPTPAGSIARSPSPQPERKFSLGYMLKRAADTLPTLWAGYVRPPIEARLLDYVGSREENSRERAKVLLRDLGLGLPAADIREICKIGILARSYLCFFIDCEGAGPSGSTSPLEPDDPLASVAISIGSPELILGVWLDMVATSVELVAKERAGRATGRGGSKEQLRGLFFYLSLTQPGFYHRASQQLLTLLQRPQVPTFTLMAEHEWSADDPRQMVQSVRQFDRWVGETFRSRAAPPSAR